MYSWPLNSLGVRSAGSWPTHHVDSWKSMYNFWVLKNLTAFAGHNLVPPEAMPLCPRWLFFSAVRIGCNPKSKHLPSPLTLEWEVGRVGQHRSGVQVCIPRTTSPCCSGWEHRQNKNSWTINQWLMQMKKKLQNKSRKISKLKLKLKTWKGKLKS